jgi:hypothetical protein
MTGTLSDYDTCDAQHDLDNLDIRDGCDVHDVFLASVISMMALKTMKYMLSEEA